MLRLQSPPSRCSSAPRSTSSHGLPRASRKPGQSINALNPGNIGSGRPALGSWLTYALGSESQNLPAFVVLTDPGGLPVLGVENWQNGWLPSLYQGTVVRPQEPRILNLDPP